MNYEDIFISYVNMNCEEIKELIKDRINTLEEYLNQDKSDAETYEIGFLMFACKQVLNNMRMACDKLIRKFSEELTPDEIEYYKKVSETVQNDTATWTNFEKIKETLDKVKSLSITNE
jgi:hypothetical protein